MIRGGAAEFGIIWFTLDAEISLYSDQNAKGTPETADGPSLRFAAA
jgi:hypothetical protein